MDAVQEVVMDVLREVCRHLEIEASTGSIAVMLSAHLPLALLLVQRHEAAQQRLTTVALGTPARGGQVASPPTPLSVRQVRQLTAWAASGEIRRGRPKGDLAGVVPADLAGDILVGPLGGPGNWEGLLIVVSRPEVTFSRRDVALAQALLEPFTTALQNDRRLHELASLREAAEAERRSLLTRIGRDEIREEIVGADSGLKLVMERVELVAPSNVPVLILGETGTGKEVISRAIHARSQRSTGPFIRVNCGAIPSELIDSQLFGHEKGSFTGAADTRKGWFERASGGTLFLDEIGELPLAAQVRLLRVLQDGLVERVGSEQPIHVDVRIVAATHRELAQMVKRGTFREDLWYRVNVFPILLPLLHERAEDIPALARHFARRAAHHFGLPYVEPSAEDLHALRQYAWPGNIRELAAVIDRAAILGNGKRLEVATALGFHGSSGGAAAAPAAAESPAGSAAVPDGRARSIATLQMAMRVHIEQALELTGGRIEGRGGAAQLLDINPHTLRARMRKLQIDWSRFRG
jgi:transcriptional regulator with GAF, ATPase, and Fis domain